MAAAATTTTSSPPEARNQEEKEARLVLQPSFLSRESYALFLIFVFALCYSLMGTFLKLASETGLPAMELTFLRSCAQGFIVVGAMFFVYGEAEQQQDEEDAVYHEMESSGNTTTTNEEKRKIRLIQQPFGQRKVLPIVLARGVIGGIGLLLYFFTMSSIPLGDATSVLSLSSIITVVASSVFLNEPLTASVVAAAICSVIGSTLIAKPTFIFGTNDDDSNDGIVNGFGYVTGLLGSCTAAAVVMLVRKAGTTGVHTLQLLFSWCLFGSFYSILLCLLTTSMVAPPSGTPALTYIVCMCFFGIVGHFCMNYGGQYAPAGLSSIVRSSLILWGYTFEVLIFGHIPDAYTVVGALLILSSLVVVAWKKFKSSGKNESNKNETTLIEVAAPTSSAGGGGAATTSGVLA